MGDHIQELLNRYQYSEEVKQAFAFRVFFISEDAKQLMQQVYHINATASIMGQWDRPATGFGCPGKCRFLAVKRGALAVRDLGSTEIR